MEICIGQNIYFHLNHPIRFVYLVAPVVALEDTHPRFSLLTIDDSSGMCIDVKIMRKDASAIVPGGSNTAISNLDIDSGINGFEIKIDGQNVDIGTVLKVKGTITSFRGTRQIELKRCAIIKDTTEEVQAWEAMATFKREVLNKPWMLTSADRAALDTKMEEEAAREREEEKRERRNQRALQKREELRGERRKAREEERERRRQLAEKKFNEGALI